MSGPTRRLALLAALAAPLGGCTLWDDLFGKEKAKLPGTRIAVQEARPSLLSESTGRSIALPPPGPIAEAPQAGGTPSHPGGHMALRDAPSAAWSSSVGTGGGARRKLTAQPLLAGGRVFTMDSDGRVAAFDAGTGSQAWRVSTEPKDDRSTNIGGGIGFDGGVLYAATGRAELLAINPADGAIIWRQKLPTPARSAPTIADGRIYLGTLDDQVFAFAPADGKKLWVHQGPAAETTVLGLPAPTFADGLVVVGFSSGEIRALRAASGTVVWADTLGGGTVKANSLGDIAAIRGLPAISGGRVYAGSLGGLATAIDLRSGRRLWEREVFMAEMLWPAGDWLFLVSSDAILSAVSRLDGSVGWAVQLDAWEDMKKLRDAITWFGPVLAGGRLWVAGSQGLMLSVDATSGKVLGTTKLSAAAAMAPVLAGGSIYVLTEDGTITCYR
jgi:outer membrane protein assembly factor BamB